jgi:hypothetical protein
MTEEVNEQEDTTMEQTSAEQESALATDQESVNANIDAYFGGKSVGRTEVANEDDTEEATEDNQEDENTEQEEESQQEESQQTEDNQEQTSEGDNEENAVDYTNWVSPDDLDALKATWAEENKPDESNKEDVFFNEESRKLDEYLRNGGEINQDFLDYRELDFDNVDLSSNDNVLDVVKKGIMLDGFTEKEATLLIEDKYSALFATDLDDASESELRTFDLAQLNAKMEAKKMLPKLKERKQAIMKPKVEAASNQPTKEQVEQNRLAQEAYQRDAQTSIDKFLKSGLDIQVDKDVTVNVKATKENTEYVRELVASAEKRNSYFVDNYQNEDGSVNFDKFTEMTFIQRNLEAYKSALINQGIAIGQEKVVTGDLNQIKPRLGKKSSSGKRTSSNSALDAWLKDNHRN